MKKHKILLISASIFIAVATLSTYAYFAPHRTLIKIREAAQKGDKEALRELIDFPSVREGIKEHANAYMMKNMEDRLRNNPFASFGMMLIPTFVDRMVDSYVTPSGIASVTKGIKLDNKSQDKNQNTDNTEADSDGNNIVRTNKYNGTSRFTATMCNKVNKEMCISLVLRREGFNWKLTSIILPEIQ